MAAISSSREGRIETSPELIWAGARPGSNDAHRLAVEEGNDIFDNLRVGAPVVLLGYVADMRGQDHIRRQAQRVVDRQRLLIVDVEPGIGEPALLERRDDRVGVADWPTRGIDQDRARLHQPNLAGSGNAAAAR